MGDAGDGRIGVAAAGGGLMGRRREGSVRAARSRERRPFEARSLTRRDFVKRTGALALGATAIPAILAACGGGGGRASGGGGNRTLRILQWSHFVPAYDKWFDPWAEAWGRSKGITVTVDHINYADIPTRTAAEISAGSGHDLILWNTPPSQYEPSVNDLSDVVQEIEKRYGPQLTFARLTNYNPVTNRYFGLTYSYAPDPGDYRKSLWSQVGLPNGPVTYDDLVNATTRIYKMTKGAVRCGIGMSPEPDSNMAARAMIWSFGGSVQDANGNVTINSPEVVDAVAYMAKLFRQAETPEVFSWTAASNNQGLVAGSLSYILNSISAYRTAQQTNPSIADDIFFVPALRGSGPKALNSEHVIQTYISPKFSRNVDVAKEFLLYLVDHASDFVYHSALYEFPVNPNTNAQQKLFGSGGWLDADPYHSRPSTKLQVLKNAQDWSVNVGYPGPASPAISEIFNTNVLPTMMAEAAKGQKTPQEAVAAAEVQVKQIFAKWRKQGLVGGSR
jgi:ABC-type glycerol-3-phosphate transport system substrate-binding protein